LINELAQQGYAIIFISSEMMELMGMCDRLLVMNEGRLKGELKKDNFSEKNIMNLILGGN
jgi:ABC-type sugar transport system ATPase subunit